jgi:hypothetical protein
MKLVFATLIRCSDRWNRVAISDLERQQVKLLRAELGIDPQPPKITSHKPRRKEKRAANETARQVLGRARGPSHLRSSHPPFRR